MDIIVNNAIAQIEAITFSSIWMELFLIVLKTVVIILGFALVSGAVLVWCERRQSAIIQDRFGPNRVNIYGVSLWGLLQVLADGVKVIFKEDFVPEKANKWLFHLAPVIAVAPTLLVFAVIPFGPGRHFVIADIHIGLLFIFAFTGLSVYGLAFAGWASSNNWSLLGGMRAAAQMFSYEVSMGLNIMGVLMVFGAVYMPDIVIGQGEYIAGFIPKWGIVVQPLGFILFMTAAIAETKRAPFDVVEADSEIVSGYFTEYSSLKFALFMLGDFLEIVLAAAFGAVLFLGGWQIPWLPADLNGWWVTVLQVLAMVIKVWFLCWLQMMIRWTVPRFRYDQVMKVGWQYILPLSFLNIFITAIVMYLIR